MRLTPRNWLIAAALIGAASLASFAQEPRPGGPGGREGRGGPPGGPMFASPLLTALDADGDGEISAKEIDNAAAALRTLDKNKDGKLTRDEYLPAFREGGGPGGPNPAELVTRMMAFDKDGDGKLTKDELPERMQGLMDRADANKDGFVTRDELTKYAQQQQQTRRGPGAGRGGPPPREGGRGPGEGGGPDREGPPRS